MGNGDAARIGTPCDEFGFSPFLTCNRMKLFFLGTGEMAQLAESIPSACFPSGQPVGSHVGNPALVNCRRIYGVIISGGSMMGALGNSFILKCCSALATFVFALWVGEGWEVSLTHQDGP